MMGKMPDRRTHNSSAFSFPQLDQTEGTIYFGVQKINSRFN